jgi:hypothetical protein
MAFDIKYGGVFALPKTEKILKPYHFISFHIISPPGLRAKHLLASPPPRDYYYDY